MSNYQRLISYIYTYEGGIKGKNIGFAKLETRGVQCKITINVKKIFVGGNPLGVYLLSNQGEIKIGTLFARNGAGEFRTTINAANIEDSGRGIEEFYGLSVHDVESAWRSYTTIWEDAVAHAAEVELADVTSENLLNKQEEKEGNTANGLDEELPISQEIEKALEREEEIPALEMREEEVTPPEISQPEIQPPKQPQPEIVVPELPQLMPQPEMPAPEPAQPATEPRTPGIEMGEPKRNTSEPRKNQPETETNRQPGSPSLTEEIPLDRIPVVRDEREIRNHQEMWEYMRKRYAKIQAFDYEDGCEILTVKPQDIGLLPRDIWAFGNNSFLLHGYYNYRYLILARLENPNGMPRYLLGVPGNYVSNEKYMAAMFGFSDFVLSKKQPVRDSRFGYWYTDIKVGE